MKFQLIFLTFLCLVIGATKTHAQVTQYDSVAVDSIYLYPNVDDPTFMLGKPDGNSAHFHGGGELAAARFIINGRPVVMKKGQPLHIYWRIDPSQNSSTDSNKAFIILQRLTDDFVPHGSVQFVVTEPRPFGGEQMATIVVPDTGYNAIAISVAVDSGANSFYVDAIVLVQSGSAGVTSSNSSVASLSSYPNPYIHSMPLTLRFNSEREGRGELLITDILGRETVRVPLGTVSIGEREESVVLDKPGVFIGRLLVNDEPVGVPLKIVSE